MEKLTQTIEINAPREKVWQVLWEDETYRQWTSVFDPESHVEGELKEGSQVKFIGSEETGMYAKVAKLVPNEFMSFEHLGELKDGEKEPYDETAFENYTLEEKGGVTVLTLEMDAPAEYGDMFSEQFPPALAKVKELAEK